MTSQNSVGGWDDDIQGTDIGGKFLDALMSDYLQVHSSKLNPLINKKNISIELLKKYISKVPVPQNISNVNNHFTHEKISKYLRLNGASNNKNVSTTPASTVPSTNGAKGNPPTGTRTNISKNQNVSTTPASTVPSTNGAKRNQNVSTSTPTTSTTQERQNQIVNLKRQIN